MPGSRYQGIAGMGGPIIIQGAIARRHPLPCLVGDNRMRGAHAQRAKNPCLQVSRACPPLPRCRAVILQAHLPLLLRLRRGLSPGRVCARLEIPGAPTRCDHAERTPCICECQRDDTGVAPRTEIKFFSACTINPYRNFQAISPEYVPIFGYSQRERAHPCSDHHAQRGSVDSEALFAQEETYCGEDMAI